MDANEVTTSGLMDTAPSLKTTNYQHQPMPPSNRKPPSLKPPSADPTDDPSYTRPIQANTTFYQDREQRGIAEMLTRYRAIISAVPMDGTDKGSKATREGAASVGFTMEAEGRALVKAAEDLLKLTRELKELWLFGPLRGIGEGEGEGKMDEDSVKVGGMLESILRKDIEGGESKLGA
ncbi:hypothetical protein HYFRA_00007071 [Hymenoscyphus fraxineus]|uniref:Uncharacterized protein n=1 Tax=Hymenoscyphus fraxineus TaxID=746836 RepID=A0A9N9PUZ8_9HELO|nr:hypothetical protein HYFRA_00007071 [Hymenoscyphus fraxineus]